MNDMTLPLTDRLEIATKKFTKACGQIKLLKQQIAVYLALFASHNENRATVESDFNVNTSREILKEKINTMQNFTSVFLMYAHQKADEITKIQCQLYGDDAVRNAYENISTEAPENHNNNNNNFNNDNMGNNFESNDIGRDQVVEEEVSSSSLAEESSYSESAWEQGYWGTYEPISSVDHSQELTNRPSQLQLIEMSKGSSTVQNGPEESWDPLTFLEPVALKEIINDKKYKKIDSKLDELSLESQNPQQKIFLKTDCVNEASGSSYIELGDTKVLCSVYGPREIPRKDDYDFKVANVNCEFRFASFSCFMQRRGQLNQREQAHDEKNFSSIIEEALKPSIFLHKYPKSQIDLYILCIQNDIDSKNILSASIVAASMALVNASIELYDLVSSYTYIPINLTVSFMPSLHQVTSIYFSNELNGACLSVDLFKSHVKESIENCKKVHAYMKSVLAKNVNDDKQNIKQIQIEK